MNQQALIKANRHARQRARARARRIAKEQPFKLTWFDRVALAIAPSWGMRRLRARAVATALVRSFDAAARGRRTAGWPHQPTDADAANRPHLGRLRDLARDIRRNNGWARRGISVIANNTVGHGIKPKIEVPGQTKDRATKLWQEWARSTDVSVDGLANFQAIQLLVMQTVVESGEALVLKRTPPPSLGRRVPLQLQVLEPDHLDNTRDTKTADDGGKIVEGIEYDLNGRRVAYHLYEEHPGSNTVSLSPRGRTSIRVPAEDVIHVFLRERAGQNRGVSWLASSILRLQEFDDFEDAELVQQRIAACFGAFVEDDGTSATTQLGEASTDEVTQQPLEAMQPGTIQYLSSGQKISFATPPTPQTDQGFTQRSLRRIAAGLMVTYEDLTGDYSQVNFSSARMARLVHYAAVWTWQHHMVIPLLCDRVWRWFGELAVAVGALQAIPPTSWTVPPIPMLEPSKEGPALSALVSGGFLTWPEAITERGRDPEAQLAEIVEWAQKFAAAGITVTGLPGASSPAAASDGSGGEADASDESEAAA